MKRYNWQQPDWSNFRYDLSSLHEILLTISEKMGVINGKMSPLTTHLKTEAIVNLMVEEAVKTSAIEGEYISRPDIRSSIQNQMGFNQKNRIHVSDKKASGIAKLMVDVRDTFKQPLTQSKLFDWHLMLFAGSLSQNLKIGRWRTHVEPMQIVSGHHNRWMVHYEAPPSRDVPKEMKNFMTWFNHTSPGKPQAIKFPPVRAAIAHLYFESIHPFEDGNGRIGRAIAEKALSQGFGYPVILSLSQAIEAQKKTYYTALHAASKSNEVTPWIHYFVNIVLNAQIYVETQIDFIIKKAKFFDTFKDSLNDRQMKAVKRMLKSGVEGFEGGMNAKKYMNITGISKATATRDLQELATMAILKPAGKGRSVRYELIL